MTETTWNFDEVLGGAFALERDGSARDGDLPATGTASVLVSAAAAAVTEAMLALVPREEDLDRLVLPGGEAREDLHLTLWFLGEAANYAPEDRERLVRKLRRDTPPRVEARAFGAALWNPDGDAPCWVLNVGDRTSDPDDWRRFPAGMPRRLAEVRDWALDELGSVYSRPVRRDIEIPEQHSPWSPHVCLAYDGDPGLAAEVAARTGPVTLDRLRVAFADEVIDVPLASAP